MFLLPFLCSNDFFFRNYESETFLHWHVPAHHHEYLPFPGYFYYFLKWKRFLHSVLIFAKAISFRHVHNFHPACDCDLCSCRLMNACWMILKFLSCAATHLIKAKLNLRRFGTGVSVIIAVFRLIHFLNASSLPSESFALRNSMCSCERKIRMNVFTRAYVANRAFSLFLFAIRFSGILKNRRRSRNLSLAYRFFFPFIDDRGHKKSDAPEWQQFKKLFSSFFSLLLLVFLRIFSVVKEEIQLFMCVLKMCKPQKPVRWCATHTKAHSTDRTESDVHNKIDYSSRLMCSAMPRIEASKHFNTFVALAFHHFDFIVWHFRLLRAEFFFCFAFVSLCGLFVVVWLNERSLTYRLSVKKSLKWKSFEFTCAPRAAVCHRLASTSLDTFLWQTFRFISSKCFNFSSCQCQLNAR